MKTKIFRPEKRAVLTQGDQAVVAGALAPASVAESYELTIKAVNLSEKFRQPVVLLLDEVIGHLREKIYLKSSEELEIVNRKKPDTDQDSDQYLPYQLTDDLIPPMADYGSGLKYHTSGLFHDQSGFPDGKSETAKLMQDRLHNKLHTIWPFAEKEVAELAAQVETIIVPELNQGQLIREVKKAAGGQARVIGINSYAGELIKPEEIRVLLEEVL